MRTRALLAAMLSLANVIAYAAAPVCYQYRVQMVMYGTMRTGDWVSTPAGACSDFASKFGSLGGYSGGSMSVVGGSGTPLAGWHCEGSLSYPGGSESWGTGASGSHENRETPGGCPTDPCSGQAGKKTTSGGAGTSVPESACVNQCEYTPSGVGVAIGNQWASQMTATGVSGSCGEGGVTNPNAPNCVSSPKGMFCASKAERNCGSVNGEKVCLNAVPPGQCQFMGDGGMVCASDAGNPPGPSDGEGAPATPDQVLSLSGGPGGTTEYNYYTSTTVAGSSTGASGSAPGGAGSSTGDDDDYEEGEEGGDVGDAGEICNGDDCYGDVPAEVAECAANQEACADGIVGSRWASITSAVPLLGFAVGLDDALATEGSCPSVQVEFFEQEHEVMGPVCGVLEENETLLALVWTIGWALVGFRILLKSE